MTIDAVHLYRYGLPLDPSLDVGGHTLERRRGLLLRVVGKDGTVGWGEAAPLPGFSGETLDEVIDDALAAVPRWTNADVPDTVNDVAHWLDALSMEDGCPPSLRFAWETAALDLVAQRREISVPHLLGAERRTVALNGLIVTPLEDGIARARALAHAGYQAVKIKVGRAEIENEVEAVRAIRAALPGSIALRLDANRAWSLEQAAAFAEALADVDVAYVEEPLAKPDELGPFARRAQLPVALDETTREVEPSVLEEMPGVSAVVLKPTLLGGVQRVDAWRSAAEKYGVVSVISSSYEAGVGIRMLIAMAARGPGAPAGLSTADRLGADVLAPGVSLDGPQVDVEAVVESDRTVVWDHLERIPEVS